MNMDLGSGAGAFEAGGVQGVRSVTFPSALAAPPALLPLEFTRLGKTPIGTIGRHMGAIGGTRLGPVSDPGGSPWQP